MSQPHEKHRGYVDRLVLAIFAVIAVVILGDFQAISAASSTIELRGGRERTRTWLSGWTCPNQGPGRVREMRDHCRAKGATKVVGDGGSVRVRSWRTRVR